MTELLETSPAAAPRVARAEAPPRRRVARAGALAPADAVRAGGPAGAVRSLPALAVGLLLLVALPLYYERVARPGGDVDALVTEAVNDHLRVLSSPRPLDVESGGIHQVKPWFEGKLDFAPEIPFAGDADFPLRGGALGYFLDRRAAVLVYQRRLHVVSLLVFRADGLAWPAQRARADGPDRGLSGLEPRLQRAAVARRRPRVRAGLRSSTRRSCGSWARSSAAQPDAPRGPCWAAPGRARLRPARRRSRARERHPSRTGRGRVRLPRRTMLPLTGYADRFSVAPGETIAFKVSSTAATPYQARLVRLISGDPNPAGPGIKEEPVPAPFAGELSRRASSRCRSAPTCACRTRRRSGGSPSFTRGGDHLADHARPGPPGHRGAPRPAAGTGFALFVDERGAGALVGDGRGGVADGPRRQAPPGERPGTACGPAYDAATRHARRAARRRSRRACGRTTPAARPSPSTFAPALDSGTPLLVAALGGAPGRRPLQRQDRARPRSTTPRSTETAVAAPRRTARPAATWWRPGTSAARPPAPARWTSGPSGLHGELVNLPARAMMGSTLDGRGDVLAPRARRSTAPSTSTTTTSTTAAGPPTSPTPCRTGSGAASTRCASGRATSRT